MTKSLLTKIDKILKTEIPFMTSSHNIMESIETGSTKPMISGIAKSYLRGCIVGGTAGAIASGGDIYIAAVSSLSVRALDATQVILRYLGISSWGSDKLTRHLEKKYTQDHRRRITLPSPFSLKRNFEFPS